MSKCNFIFEYDSIAADENRKGEKRDGVRYVSSKQFEMLENFILSNVSEGEDAAEVMRLTSRHGKKQAVACNYVGVITLADGTTIEILPKIGKICQEGDARRLLIKMLRTLRSVPYKVNQSANIDVAKLPLFEVFVRMFIDEIYAVIRRGIRCGYERVEENQKFFKGKLLVGRHIMQNAVHKERFYVEYDEFNANRAENKLIKSALLYLHKKSCSFANQADLRSLLAVFDEVKPSENVEQDLIKSCRERGTEHYLEAIKWCGVFLAGKSFSMFEGSQYAKALLFPMEKLFESYIAAELSRKFSGEYSISTQEQQRWLFDSPKKFKLRPDIVMRRGNLVFILDTKWKLLNNDPSKNYGISQADMYQMYAYHKKYEKSAETDFVKHCILLYPSMGEEANSRISFSASDGVNVSAFFIDLMNVEKSLENLRPLIDDVV